MWVVWRLKLILGVRAGGRPRGTEGPPWGQRGGITVHQAREWLRELQGRREVLGDRSRRPVGVGRAGHWALAQGHQHLPVQEKDGAPSASPPLQASPLGLPQRLGAQQRSCQDEVEEEEAKASPGVQCSQHGEHHLPPLLLPPPLYHGTASPAPWAASQREWFQGPESAPLCCAARPNTTSSRLTSGFPLL